MPELSLFETAVEAAQGFPVAWKRSPGVLAGTYAGRHGMYAVSIASERPGLLVARAEIGERPRRDRRVQAGLLCLAATRRSPTGGFHLPAGEGSRVRTFAVVGNERGADLPESAVVRNAIRSCLLDAERVAPMVQRTNTGAVIAGAIARGNDMFEELCAGGLPAELRPGGPSPATDAGLIDACEHAAGSAGWFTWRRGPRQLMVDSGNETPSGPAVTFIDALDGVVIASAYAFGPDRNVPVGRLPAVSGLLNHMIGEGAPYALALDLESGAVASHGFLDVAGSASLPAPGIIRDLISRVMGGALSTLSPVMRVAHDGVHPEAACFEAGQGLLDRRAS